MSEEQTLGVITSVASTPPVLDPLAPDAPIHHLLSLRHNPSLANATPDELRAIVQSLRTLATSAPSMSSKLQRDSDNISPRKRTGISAKRKALLDEI